MELDNFKTRICVMPLNSPVQPGLSFRISFQTDRDQSIDITAVELYATHSDAHLGSAKSGFLADALEESLTPTQLTLIYAHVHEFERVKAAAGKALAEQVGRAKGVAA